MNISKRLQYIRKKKHIKLYALSRDAGLSLLELKNIETGKLSPSIYTLGKLLDAMNCSFSELFRSSSQKSMLTEQEKRMIDIIIDIDKK